MGIDKSGYAIHIIGAGVSGLIAALVLEKHGYAPTILEATDSVGGRVKSDVINGIPLDYGFQVVLTAYPMVKKYLDIDALSPYFFDSGAMVYTYGHMAKIGDPLRHPNLLLPTLFSAVASFGDKIKIFKLQQELKKKSIKSIFEAPEQRTLSYLEDKGFSQKVISTFFIPFFSGIFLEGQLATSSRMFEFVYKMFSEGQAMIPQKGMGAIPQQLQSKLNQTKISFNTKVAKVSNGHIHLEDGNTLDSHFTIIATDASTLVSNLRKQELKWKRCDTLYFEVPKMTSKSKLIGLVADEGALVNNIVRLSQLFELNHKRDVLSVTVVKEHHLSDEELLGKVTEELKRILQVQELQFLKHYPIQKALPEVSNLKNELSPEETRLTTQIFLAGDYLLNGSLNAAMKSGEQAALGVIHLLEESPDLAQFTSEYL